jgi:catechol 2,3-dioxygenase-like lactoylglutathione lyase family enzyme
MVHLLNTHHFNFTVADMDRSLRFWRDALGLEVLNDWVSEASYLAEITGHARARMRLAFLRLPGTEARLELIQYLEPPGAPRDQPTNAPGAAHLCFDVPDIQAAYDELRARGVPFRSAPVEITSAANRGAMGVYLSDPDGITLELRQPPAT